MRAGSNKKEEQATKVDFQNPQIGKTQATQGIKRRSSGMIPERTKEGLDDFEKRNKVHNKAESITKQNGALVYLQEDNNNKNLNNYDKKTAKVNFSGLPDSKAWKFAQKKSVQKFLKLAESNQAVFEALSALLITCTLRPAAILAQNNDSNREKNKKAASHSIASGLIGYGFAVALFSPVSDGLKKIKANPQNYLPKTTNNKNVMPAFDFFQHEGLKKVSMEASKRFAAFTMTCSYAPQLVTAAIRASITIALIPAIDRYILNPIMGTGKKASDKKSDSPAKDPLYSYSYLSFTQNPSAKRTFQSFAGDKK